MTPANIKLDDYVWHALYCPPQRELITAHDLAAIGHPFIVPAEKRWFENKHLAVKWGFQAHNAPICVRRV